MAEQGTPQPEVRSTRRSHRVPLWSTHLCASHRVSSKMVRVRKRVDRIQQEIGPLGKSSSKPFWMALFGPGVAPCFNFCTEPKGAQGSSCTSWCGDITTKVRGGNTEAEGAVSYSLLSWWFWGAGCRAPRALPIPGPWVCSRHRTRCELAWSQSMGTASRALRAGLDTRLSSD